MLLDRNRLQQERIECLFDRCDTTGLCNRNSFLWDVDNDKRMSCLADRLGRDLQRLSIARVGHDGILTNRRLLRTMFLCWSLRNLFDDLSGCCDCRLLLGIRSIRSIRRRHKLGCAEHACTESRDCMVHDQNLFVARRKNGPGVVEIGSFVRNVGTVCDCTQRTCCKCRWIAVIAAMDEVAATRLIAAIVQCDDLIGRSGGDRDAQRVDTMFFIEDERISECGILVGARVAQDDNARNGSILCSREALEVFLHFGVLLDERTVDLVEVVILNELVKVKFVKGGLINLGLVVSSDVLAGVKVSVRLLDRDLTSGMCGATMALVAGLVVRHSERRFWKKGSGRF